MLVPACSSCQAPCFQPCCQFCGLPTCWNFGPCASCYPQAIAILSHQLVTGDTCSTALVETSTENIYALLRNSDPETMAIRVPLRRKCILTRISAPEIVSWSQNRGIGLPQIANRLSKELEWDIPSGIVLVSMAMTRTSVFVNGKANGALLDSAISYVRRFEGSIGITIDEQCCYIFEVLWSTDQTRRLTRYREIILRELSMW